MRACTNSGLRSATASLCAHTHTHEIAVVLISSVVRLDAYLDLVLGATSENRASLAQVLDYQLTGGTEGVPDDGRARLRVEYMTHAGDFLGCEAGLGLESCLSLSLPGQPHGTSMEALVCCEK